MNAVGVLTVRDAPSSQHPLLPQILFQQTPQHPSRFLVNLHALG